MLRDPRRVGVRRRAHHVHPPGLKLCERLGIDAPIVQAPIGRVSSPELAAAVSNAGGLGMLGLCPIDDRTFDAITGSVNIVTEPRTPTPR